MTMKVPTRISLLFFLGVFAAGSTALGYYYYFVYHPPLEAAEEFLKAMEAKDPAAVKRLIIFSTDSDDGELREGTDMEVELLLAEGFMKGRILEQRKRSGNIRDYYDLVYREPDGQIYKLLVTRIGKTFRVVIPERRMTSRERYLWEYTWTN